MTAMSTHDDLIGRLHELHREMCDHADGMESGDAETVRFAIDALTPRPEITALVTKTLKHARTFIEYARYELQPGEMQLGDQFPRQGCADKEMAAIDSPAPQRTPLKLDVSREWCEGAARREAEAGDPDITVGSPAQGEATCEGGVTVRWCPRCGTCTCPALTGSETEWPEDPQCPIHGTRSDHDEPQPPTASPEGQDERITHRPSPGRPEPAPDCQLAGQRMSWQEFDDMLGDITAILDEHALVGATHLHMLRWKIRTLRPTGSGQDERERISETCRPTLPQRVEQIVQDAAKHVANLLSYEARKVTIRTAIHTALEAVSSDDENEMPWRFCPWCGESAVLHLGDPTMNCGRERPLHAASPPPPSSETATKD